MNGIEPSYFCDECKRFDDQPIPPDALFRRVTVTMDIELAAVNVLPGAAHAEALEIVEELVRQAGGLLNLHRVSSIVGRPAVQPRARERRAARERV